MLARNDALEARLRHVETKPSLDLDAVDAAIERIRRPDTVREQIGDALLYAQRVEAEVGGLSIETLLPHSTDDYVGRFLHVWVPDEQGHGEAQARLARLSGCSPTNRGRRTPSRSTTAPPGSSLGYCRTSRR